MKNSTKILGIFLAAIFIIFLALLFMAKFYIDSRSSSLPTIDSLKQQLLNFSNQKLPEIDFEVKLDDLKNLDKLESDFFTKADQYIKDKTNFEPKNKNEINLNSVNKSFKIDIKLSYTILIFSDSTKPKISYKFYSKKNKNINPIETSGDNINFYPTITNDMFNNDDLYLFAFIILPSSFEELKIDSNRSLIQILTQKLFSKYKIESYFNASKTEIISEEFLSKIGYFDFNASEGQFNIGKIDFESYFFTKLNASRFSLQSDSIKTKDLKLDFNASNSFISIKKIDISSSARIFENTGKYTIKTEEFINYPSIFTYRSNMTTTTFEIKNCKDFYIKSRLNASSVSINAKQQIQNFSSNFELKSRDKIDEKNILNINFDINMSKLEIIFQ